MQSVTSDDKGRAHVIGAVAIAAGAVDAGLNDNEEEVVVG